MRGLEEGEQVFYQEKDKVAWLGPVKVFCQRVYDFANGNIKKLHACKVKPFKCHVTIGVEDVDKGKDKEEVGDGDHQVEAATFTDDHQVETDTFPDDVVDKNELGKDVIGTFWMKIERNECYNNEITTYVVELPVSQHKKTVVLEVKAVEMKNI